MKGVSPWLLVLLMQAGGVQQRMKPAAALALVVYAAGIPLAFFWLLLRHRAGIVADQTLKLQGMGNTKATNPNFHIRRRLQKLYVGRLCVMFVEAGLGSGCSRTA